MGYTDEDEFRIVAGTNVEAEIYIDGDKGWSIPSVPKLFLELACDDYTRDLRSLL